MLSRIFHNVALFFSVPDQETDTAGKFTAPEISVNE